MGIGKGVKNYKSMLRKVFLILALFPMAATVYLTVLFVLPGIKDPVSLLKFSRTQYVVFSFVLFVLWTGVVTLFLRLESRFLTRENGRGTIVLAGIINAATLLWLLFSLILSAAGFSDNVGTIRISNAEELSYIRNYPSGEYVLTKDIDMKGEEWNSISKFKGSIDGNGYAIINITVGKNGFIKENLGKISSLTLSKIQYWDFNDLKEGVSKQRCQVCGSEELDVLPADGDHQYAFSSFNSEGRAVTYICGRCGTVHKESLLLELEQFLWNRLEVYHEKELPQVDEVEKNGSIEKANPVADFTKVKAFLQYENNVDCFSFTVNRKCNMEFDFSHEEDDRLNYYWYVTLYDTDGVTIIYESNIPPRDKGKAVTYSIPELEPGTYYIKVSRSVGEGSMYGYSNAFYYITFCPRCVQHELVKTYLLKEPTCAEDGAYINVCDECDEQVSTGVIKALGHKWSEWHMTKEAGILSRGEQERICSGCRVAEREYILHSGSVVMMIVAAVVMIVIIVLLAVNEKYGWMTVAIILTAVLCIAFYIILFAERKPGTHGTDVKPLSITQALATPERPAADDADAITNSCDGDLKTCWQDGAEGNGEGTVLTYYFEHPCYAVGMDIVNGRVDAGKEIYYENNRIRSMTLYCFRDGAVTASVQLNMEDVYSSEAKYYALALDKTDEAYYCEGIQIVINSVYEGSGENANLCLTEIQFYEGGCE